MFCHYHFEFIFHLVIVSDTFRYPSLPWTDCAIFESPLIPTVLKGLFWIQLLKVSIVCRSVALEALQVQQIYESSLSSFVTCNNSILIELARIIKVLSKFFVKVYNCIIDIIISEFGIWIMVLLSSGLFLRGGWRLELADFSDGSEGCKLFVDDGAVRDVCLRV